MSSLWSLIRKGREIRYDPEHLSAADADQIFNIVMGSQPHLVNISEQVKEWNTQSPNSPIDYMAMDATPCFSCLWMEWILIQQRFGVLINRLDVTGELTTVIELSGKKMMLPFKGSKHLLQFLFFVERQGYPEFHGTLSFYIDAMGHPLEGVELAASQNDKRPIEAIGLMLADILTTMNTKGTRIEPPFPHPVQIVKPDRHPYSVWHTIHLPRFARPPLDGAVISSEILERREHWVRGHRKDYRGGNGMFGRIKALVWVPEFQRGNPELGTVKQTYEVHR